MGIATRRKLGLLAAGCMTAAFGVTAAGSTPVATASPVRVVMPAGPGQPAKAGTSDKVPAPPAPGHTAADVWFVRMMIPHHAQAIQMSQLAAGRAGNPRIAAIAERMNAAQQPEIAGLRAWLKARGLAQDDSTGHDHTSMPGMQTPEALQALEGARGADFDTMFVAMMSAHHQGAIEMAGLRLRSEGDPMVEKMAEGIAFEQGVEINRMRDILSGT